MLNSVKFGRPYEASNIDDI